MEKISISFATTKHILHAGNISVCKEGNVENFSLESQEMILKNGEKKKTLCNGMYLHTLHGILDNNLCSQKCAHLFSVYEHRYAGNKAPPSEKISAF